MTSFLHPSVVWRSRSGEGPLEFPDEITQQKLEGSYWSTYGENFIILTSTVLTDPPVWQTDGRTGGRAGDSIYIALSMLSRAKTYHKIYVKFTINKWTLILAAFTRWWKCCGRRPHFPVGEPLTVAGTGTLFPWCLQWRLSFVGPAPAPIPLLVTEL